MSTPLHIPRGQAAALSSTLDAIRSETAALHAEDVLAVSADGLIGGAGDVIAWIEELEHAVDHGRSVVVAMPTCSGGELQHIVYTVSAVLVWADELHADARLHTRIPDDALEAWRFIEEAAGLPDRTRSALRARAAERGPTVTVITPNVHLPLMATV